MSFERVRVTAGGVIKEIGLGADEVVLLSAATDFSAPDAALVAATGREGSYKLTDDTYPDRQIVLGIDGAPHPSSTATVTNLVSGRTPVSATSSGADVLIPFTADTSGGVPSSSVAALAVFTPAVCNISVEVLRSGSVIASSTPIASFAGAWSRVLLPSATLTGSGALVVRARISGAASGVVVWAARPILGPPIDGYFDGYTLGCDWTGTVGSSASTRPGSVTGTEWSQAIKSDAGQVAGALQLPAGGTVDRWDSQNNQVTFDASTGTPAIPEDASYYLGQLAGSLKVTARALGRRPEVAIPGSFAGVGAWGKWTATAPIPGGVSALLRVVPAFSSAPRAFVAAASGVQRVTASSLTGTGAGSGLVTETGSLSSQPLAVQQTPAGGAVATFTAPSGIVGPCRFFARVMGVYDVTSAVTQTPWAPGWGTVAVGTGQEVGEPVSIFGAVRPSGAGSSHSSFDPWEFIDLGEITVQNAGDQVTIYGNGGRFLIDVVDCLADSPSALIYADSIIPHAPIRGDDFANRPAIGTNMAGRSGTLGGSWSAGRVVQSLRTGSTLSDLALGSASGSVASTLSAAVAPPYAVDIQFVLDSASGTQGVFFTTDSFSGISVAFALAGYSIQDSTYQAGFQVEGPAFLPGVPYSARLVVDDHGRFSLAAAPTGQTLRELASGVMPGQASTSCTLQVTVNPDVCVESVAVSQPTIDAFASGDNVWPPDAGRSLYGSKPTAAAGSKPTISVRPILQEEGFDSSASAPSGITVYATPRVLEVV